MKYGKKIVVGDSGEYYFAYWLTKNWGWAVRLLPVDLGVDAEIEIVSNGQSTSNFIKVQIKSSANVRGKKHHTVTVTERHIKYWSEINIPVIVCLVDIKNEEIYWKVISTEEDYSSNGKRNRVKFDLIKNKLTNSCSVELEALAIPTEKILLNKLRNRINENMEMLKGKRLGLNLIKEAKLIEETNTLVNELDNLLSLHKGLNSRELNQKLKNLKQKLNNIDKENSRQSTIDLYGI